MSGNILDLFELQAVLIVQAILEEDAIDCSKTTAVVGRTVNSLLLKTGCLASSLAMKGGVRLLDIGQKRKFQSGLIMRHS